MSYTSLSDSTNKKMRFNKHPSPHPHQKNKTKKPQNGLCSCIRQRYSTKDGLKPPETEKLDHLDRGMSKPKEKHQNKNHNNMDFIERSTLKVTVPDGSRRQLLPDKRCDSHRLTHTCSYVHKCRKRSLKITVN